MINMMSRKELQKSILEKADSNRIILQWGTGLGKTKTAIDLIKYYNSKQSNLKVLLIVAEIAHKNNWNDEFIKWGLPYIDLTVECYASLKKYVNTSWDMIIFDEAHHLGSDLRMDIIESIKSTRILALSATLPESIKELLNTIYGRFEVSTVSLKQAINWGILPEPKIYLIPLTLNNTDYNCTIIEEWGLKNYRVTYKCRFEERWIYIKNKHKYQNVTLEISCTQQQKYNYLTEQFTYWKNQYMRRRIEYMKNKWMQAGSKRKRFLGECKTRAAYELLSKIQDKRFICFCSSIEQAELLGCNNAIHSERKDSLSVINDFNLGKINNLFAVNMVQEGQNLVNIQAGIIIQLDGQERAFIQKFGRSMRAENPVQFIFYYKNTRDEEYLKNVLENVDNNYIVNMET